MAYGIYLVPVCFYMTGGIKVFFYIFIWLHFKWCYKDQHNIFSVAPWHTKPKVFIIHLFTENVCPNIEYTVPINKLKWCYNHCHILSWPLHSSKTNWSSPSYSFSLPRQIFFYSCAHLVISYFLAIIQREDMKLDKNL